MWFRKNKASSGEAEQALADAHQNLREVKKRGPEVSQVTQALKEFRERNHIAEQLQVIMEGRG